MATERQAQSEAEQRAERNPFESLQKAIAFSSNDWAQNKRDAWIYGIVMGWGDSLEEVARLHRWDEQEQKRLRFLESEFAEAWTLYNASKRKNNGI